jgi:HK97 family phage major capsid protein
VYAHTAYAASFEAVVDDREQFAVGGAEGPILVSALVVPWNTSVPMGFGDTVEFAPGSVNPPVPGHVKFALDHRTGTGWFADSPKPFGFGVHFDVRADGLHGVFAIPRDELDDPEVATAVRQMRNGVRDGVSAGLGWEASGETVSTGRRGMHRRVTAAELYETSTVVLPRFDAARTTGIAASRLTADTEPEPEPEETEETETDPEETDMTDTAEVTDLERAQLHRRAVFASSNPEPPRRAVMAGPPRTFGQFARDVAAGTVGADERAAIGRTLLAALVDEVTADITGLVPDAWISQVVQLVQGSTPTVQAFSRIPLPDSGMTVHIPVVTQLPTVGLQATEKGAIASGKTLVTPTSYPVRTYAGGEDVSLQAIMRSDPSYMTILMNAYAVQMALQMEDDVAAAIALAAPAGGTWPATVDALTDPLIDAAAAMLGTLGRLPDVAVISADVWATFAKARDSTGRPLYPTIGPVNAAGTIDLGTPSGSVHGLTYFVSSAYGSGVAIVGIREAWVSLLGAPIILGPVDNVAQAGRDVGVAQFAAYGATDTRGLAKITGTLPTPTGGVASGRSSSSSTK